VRHPSFFNSELLRASRFLFVAIFLTQYDLFAEMLASPCLIGETVQANRPKLNPVLQMAFRFL
jgi:hypothetical protein